MGQVECCCAEDRSKEKTPEFLKPNLSIKNLSIQTPNLHAMDVQTNCDDLIPTE